MEDDALCAAAQRKDKSAPTMDIRIKTKEVQVTVGLGNLTKSEAHDALVQAVIQKYQLGGIDPGKIRVDFSDGRAWPRQFSVEVEDYGG